MTITKKYSKAFQMRAMYAEGYTLEHIAVQLRAKPHEVRRILAREPGPGRPRHTLTLDDQLRWAKRIYESTSNERSKELAAELVAELDCQRQNAP